MQLIFLAIHVPLEHASFASQDTGTILPVIASHSYPRESLTLEQILSIFESLSLVEGSKILLV